MVRLKAPDYRDSTATSAVSIPYGTIKSKDWVETVYSVD